MTSKIVVNNIESDSGISSVTLNSNIAGEDSTQNISGINSVTATTFHGSGANLTSLPAQATIANNADNRVITGGSGVNLNGEAGLTYNGQKFQVDTVTSESNAFRVYNTSTSATTYQINGEGDSFTGNVYPRSDGNLDLGFHSGYKWRDVVLSGGVRFGNANAANYLDDYEEGVFNPTMANSVTLHSGSDTLSYVKVGHLVHVTGVVRINSGNSGADFSITNMPFATVNSTESSGNAIGSVSIYDNNMNSGFSQVICVMNPNSTQLNVVVMRQSGSQQIGLDCSDNGYIGVSITYRAA